MDATGEPYTVAARAHDDAPPPAAGYVTAADLASRATQQAEISRRADALGRYVSWSRVAEAVAADVFAPVGGLVPPDDWPLMGLHRFRL